MPAPRPHQAIVLALSLPLALAACDRAPSEPAGPVGGPRAQAEGGALQSATGSGHTLAGGELRTLTFNAVRHPDGGVSGFYQIDVRASGLAFRVDVTCLRIQDNIARIGGIITESTNDALAPVGMGSYFLAIDNGEGAGAEPDSISVAGTRETPLSLANFCNGLPAALDLPRNQRTVLFGNVQVRE